MKDKTIFLLVGLTLAILVLLPYLGLVPRFAISDSDFISDGAVTLLSSTYSAENDSVAFSFVENVNYAMANKTIFYTIGNSTDVSMTVPNPTGTNTINKYQIDVVSGVVQLSKWHTVYTKEIQTVYQNVSVPGPTVQLNATSNQICAGLGGTYSNVTCTCPNGSKWYDNSTSKVCGALTVTTTVTVEPNFWQKYGAAGIVFIVMGLIIIYLIYKRTR